MIGLVLSFLSGYIALSYEILWYRAYSFTSMGTADAFALLLGALSPLPTYVSPGAVAAGLITSTLVGVLFGAWPAARAAAFRAG